MNQMKIGEFIAKCRQEKKLSQTELANEIGVTNKAISKWENGRCLPDVSLFKPLCKNLDISINELLNGEKDKKDRNEEGYINYVGYTNKKNKLKIIISTLIFILIIISLTLGIYFVNNYNKTKIFELYGESKNFYYKGGLLVLSNDQNVLSSGKIGIINNEIKEEHLIAISLKYNNNTMLSGPFLEGASISREDYGYNEIFTEERINNLDKWYIEVTYIKDDKIKTEKVKVKNHELIRTNKFVSKKSQSIGKEGSSSKVEIPEELDMNKYEKEFLQRNKLLKEGFKEEGSAFRVVRIIDNEEYREMIDILLLDKKIRYSYDTKEDYKIYIEHWYEDAHSFDINVKKDGKESSYSYIVDNKELRCLSKTCIPNIEQEAEDFSLLLAELLTVDS